MCVYPRTLTQCVCTHVYDVGQVVDVVLEHRGVGGLQREQVLVAGLQSLQLVLRVLGLPLVRTTGEEEEGLHHSV